MKKFHITFFVRLKPSPILSGVTIEAENIVEAIGRFCNDTGKAVSEIKYAIEL